jgi:predicted nucleic acid-binding protein
VRYWDASAIVPLLVGEAWTGAARAWLSEDAGIVTWWGTPIECVSALARRARERLVRETDVAEALARLDALADAWIEVAPGDVVRRTAVRLLRAYPLRAPDAFQLAAAIVAADGLPGSVPFLTFDDRLAEAASKEGFPIVPPPGDGTIDALQGEPLDR